MIRQTALAALSFTCLACTVATPFGDVDDVDARYSGTWTLSWSTNNPTAGGLTAACSGSITLGDQDDNRFGGTFIILADQGCIDGSPVSGAVMDGRIRSDGGLNFTMEVPPTVGEVKGEDDVWEDIFAGSAVILPDLILGCVIIDADNQMNGALTAGTLAVSASASMQCPSGTVQLQVRFTGGA